MNLAVRVRWTPLLLCLGLGGFVCSSVHAAEAPPFELVLIDAASEQRLGGFPVDRRLVAQAVTTLQRAGAKAVVLKFFYDQPGNAESDRALVTAVGAGKTLLQARIDDTEPTVNPLPDRFTMSGIAPDSRAAISGTKGWIPLPALAEAAFDVGFVDSAAADRVPVFERYAGRPVKSLALAALEAAYGDKAAVDRGRLRMGNRSVALTPDHQIAWRIAPGADRALTYLPFTALLDGKSPLQQFAGKVVVVGYDGTKMHSIQTEAGEVKAHRLFYLGLLESWRQLR